MWTDDTQLSLAITRAIIRSNSSNDNTTTKEDNNNNTNSTAGSKAVGIVDIETIAEEHVNAYREFTVGKLFGYWISKCSYRLDYC